MKGLLYKEFVLMRVWLTILFIFYVLISLLDIILIAINTTSNIPTNELAVISAFCFFTLFFIAEIMNSELLKKDEGTLWGCFVISTPQSAKGHVQSKYYTILIFNLILLTGCIITDCIGVIIANDSQISVLSACSVFFCLTLIVNSIELPFMFRFGATNGLNLKAIIILGFPLLIGIYFLFGDISMFLEKEPLEALAEFLIQGKIMWFIAVLPFFTILIYYASYRLSVKLYLKGVDD